MQVLRAETAGDELGREPVKQFGMLGLGRLHTEVVCGLDEPATEVALPDAVDPDTMRQRVIGRCQPVGQFRATARRPFVRRRDDRRIESRLAAQDRRVVRRQFLKRLVVAAVLQQMRFWRNRREFGDGHHVRFSRRFGLFVFRLGQQHDQLVASSLFIFGDVLGKVVVFVLHLPLGPERELPLHRGAFFGRTVDRGEHVGRELHPLVARHLDPRGLLDLVQLVPYVGGLIEPLLLLTTVLGQLLVLSDGHFVFEHDPGEERLQLIEV